MPSALANLREQIAFIAEDSPAAAHRVGDRIRTAGNELGRFATGRRGRMNGTYEKLVSGLPYLIVYTAREAPTGRTMIAILRVIHTARDWPAGDWPE